MALSINKIVADLEYCKEIKNLGVKQKSIFSYIYHESMYADRHYEVNQKNEWRLSQTIINPTDLCGEQISAWTASELGEMLPQYITLTGNHYSGDCVDNLFYFDLERIENNWVYFYTNGEEVVFQSGTNENEVNARAKVLLYLLKNNIISLEEVNSNL